MVDLYQTYWCQHDKRVTIVRSGLSYLLLIVHITRANDTSSVSGWFTIPMVSSNIINTCKNVRTTRRSIEILLATLIWSTAHIKFPSQHVCLVQGRHHHHLARRWLILTWYQAWVQVWHEGREILGQLVRYRTALVRRSDVTQWRPKGLGIAAITSIQYWKCKMWYITFFARG